MVHGTFWKISTSHETGGTGKLLVMKDVGEDIAVDVGRERSSRSGSGEACGEKRRGPGAVGEQDEDLSDRGG